MGCKQSGWSSFCSQATKLAKGKGKASLRSLGAHGKEKERIRVLLNKFAKSGTAFQGWAVFFL